MKTLENYQQHAMGHKEQTVIMDSALTAETDELNLDLLAVGFAGPEDEDEDDDDDFPSREDIEYEDDDQDLDKEVEDPDFNNDDEEEEFY
ncbi:hypothetical protein [Pedobacter africanus]|uniref:Uncharacterized protein n=1 Tax=Pedobacter africanus TaxID=151894 RepID=A0A1W2DBM5_9SPHI|nr:hypothetical protein [Pedobacter africanus]SMC94875.1 hypothetical protein SAMN04488524_3566 [Pedobacter africanus]